MFLVDYTRARERRSPNGFACCALGGSPIETISHLDAFHAAQCAASGSICWVASGHTYATLIDALPDAPYAGCYHMSKTGQRLTSNAVLPVEKFGRA